MRYNPHSGEFVIGSDVYNRPRLTNVGDGWILQGKLDSMFTSNVISGASNLLTAIGSGVSIVDCQLRIWGQLCELHVTLTNNNAITLTDGLTEYFGTIGRIKDIYLKYYPAVQPMGYGRCLVYKNTVSTSAIYFTRLNTNGGWISIDRIFSLRPADSGYNTIKAGTTFSIDLTYMRSDTTF